MIEHDRAGGVKQSACGVQLLEWLCNARPWGEKRCITCLIMVYSKGLLLVLPLLHPLSSPTHLLYSQHLIAIFAQSETTDR